MCFFFLHYFLNDVIEAFETSRGVNERNKVGSTNGPISSSRCFSYDTLIRRQRLNLIKIEWSRRAVGKIAGLNFEEIFSSVKMRLNFEENFFAVWGIFKMGETIIESLYLREEITWKIFRALAQYRRKLFIDMNMTFEERGGGRREIILHHKIFYPRQLFELEKFRRFQITFWTRNFRDFKWIFGIKISEIPNDFLNFKKNFNL